MPVIVQVAGSGALFTQPGLTAERMTYSVMTPTAAIGVLEAIFWKPEIRYRIEKIEVLKDIRTFTLRRNETTDLPSLVEAASGSRMVNTVDTRVQRNALCLKDVEYRIHAHIDVKPHATKPESAYRDQLRRRVERGRCFAQPYLGAREFAARFGRPDDRTPIRVSAALGMMLHSIDYTTTPRQSTWFPAELKNGVLHVPRYGLGIDPTGEA